MKVVPTWKKFEKRWCTVLVEKLTDPQVVENFPAFYRTRKFRPVFAKPGICHSPEQDQFFFFVILSSTTKTPGCFISFRLISNILFSHVHEPCANPYISLDFITLSVLEEQRRLSGLHKTFYSGSPSGFLMITSTDISVARSAFGVDYIKLHCLFKLNFHCIAQHQYIFI